MFTIASVTTNLSALVVGTLLDRRGPRSCSVIGSFFLFLGSLTMAYAGNMQFFDGYLAGNFCFALGGIFIFVPSFHLSNAFPRFQGLILALVTGAFDASAAVLFIFNVIYTSSHGAFGMRHFFLLYLAIPTLIPLAHLTFMPRHIYKTSAELRESALSAKDATADVHSSDDEIDDDRELWRVRSARQDVRERTIEDIRELLGSKAERRQRVKRDEEKREASGVWGALHGLSAQAQIRTPWFVLITLLTVVQMVRMNFFIATITLQYEHILQSAEAARRINEFFDVALPIGGIATVPFIGLLLDNTSTATVLGLLLCVSTAIGFFGVLPFLWAGYANVCLFVIFRPLYYSAMS